MTEGQATAIIVLLSIPVGVIALAALIEMVVRPIYDWRVRRQSKKNEPLRKCESDIRDLKWEVKRLWESVKLLHEKCPPPKPPEAH